MACKDVGVRGVETGVLVGAAEERPGVTHVILIEGPLVRDQDREARSARSPGPPGLLPGRGDRAGVPGDHDRVEAAHIDPEFERVRRHHAAKPSLFEAALDRPPLLREVSRTVGGHELRFRDGLAGPGPDQLGALPGGGEAEGLEAMLDAAGEEPPRVGEGRPLSGRGRVVEDELAGAAGRAALVDQHGRAARQGPGELDRVREGRSRDNEDGVATVVTADALEPSQEEGDVRAEDPPVPVCLVHDHDLESGEEPVPLRMPGEDLVEFVRVREDDPGPVPDAGPSRCRGVAIVDGRTEGEPGGGLDLLKDPELVVRQRLGRVEVERRRLPVEGQPLEHGEREGQRLARRRGGGQHEIAPLANRVECPGLVRVEPDPFPGEPSREWRRERTGRLRVLRRPRGDLLYVGDAGRRGAPPDRRRGALSSHGRPRGAGRRA